MHIYVDLDVGTMFASHAQLLFELAGCGRDAYEVLGLHRSTSQEEIRKAYKAACFATSAVSPSILKPGILSQIDLSYSPNKNDDSTFCYHFLNGFLRPWEHASTALDRNITIRLLSESI
eukprot:481001-Amphidinium_carterae.1